MTQPSSGTVTTPGDAGAGADAPLLDPTLRTQLAPELLAALDQHEGVTSDDEPTEGEAQQQPAPPASEEAGGKAEADGEAPDGEADDKVATFVDLLDENPANISQVPRDLQAAVVAQWKESYETAAATTMQQVAQRFAQQGYQRAQVEYAVKDIDRLLDEGETEKANDQIRAFPGGVKGYYRVKAEMPDATEVEAGSPASFQSQLNELTSDLEAHPAAKAEFQATFASKGYRADQASLLRAAKDIGALIAKHAATPDPARVTLERRREGIRSAQATPKADVSRGQAGASDELTHEKLSKMTPQEIQRIPKEKLDAVLVKR